MREIFVAAHPVDPSKHCLRRWKVAGALYEYYTEDQFPSGWYELEALSELDCAVRYYDTAEEARLASERLCRSEPVQFLVTVTYEGADDAWEVTDTRAELQDPHSVGGACQPGNEELESTVVSIVKELGSGRMPWAAWRREADRRGVKVLDDDSRATPSTRMNRDEALHALRKCTVQYTTDAPTPPRPDEITEAMAGWPANQYSLRWFEVKRLMMRAGLRVVETEQERDCYVMLPRRAEAEVRRRVVVREDGGCKPKVGEATTSKATPDGPATFGVGDIVYSTYVKGEEHVLRRVTDLIPHPGEAAPYVSADCGSWGSATPLVDVDPRFVKLVVRQEHPRPGDDEEPSDDE